MRQQDETDINIRRLNALNSFSSAALEIVGTDGIIVIALNLLHSLFSLDASIGFLYAADKGTLLPKSLRRLGDKRARHATAQPVSCDNATIQQREVGIFNDSRGMIEGPHSAAFRFACLELMGQTFAESELAGTVSYWLPMFQRNGRFVGVLLGMRRHDASDMPVVSSGNDQPLLKLARTAIETAFEVEFSTRAFRTLVLEGRFIASQGTLPGISDRLEAACQTFVDMPLEFQIFYSKECYVGRNLPTGFFKIDEQGEPLLDTLVSSSRLVDTFDRVIPVIDPQTTADLAMMALRSADLDILGSVMPMYAVFANTAASAITTIRLREAFAIIRRRTQEMQTVLSSINQGICLLRPDLTIENEYSRHLEILFQREKLGGESFLEVVFSRAELPSDEVLKTKTILNGVFLEKLFTFDVNKRSLPWELRVAGHSSSTPRVLEVDWIPILNSDEVVERCMVTFRDVTELRAMRASVEANEREMAMVNQLVRITAEEFDGIHNSVQKLIAEVRYRVKAEESLGLVTIAAIKRELHTIKGNARSLGLSFLAKATHETEDVLASFEGSGHEPLDSVWRAFDEIVACVKGYDVVSRERLNRSSEIERERLRALHEASGLIRKLTQVVSPGWGEMERGILNQLRGCILDLQHESLVRLVERLEQGTRLLAEELGRPVPLFRLVAGESWLLSEDAEQTIFSACVQLVRNTLAHGGRGWSGAPRVSLRVQIVGEQAEVTYQADCDALDLPTLVDLAIVKGVVATTPEDAADLVFLSGLSTAEKISEVSGRGVGMAAIRAAFEKIDGTVTLQLVQSPREIIAGRLEPFAVVMSLPAQHFIKSA